MTMSLSGPQNGRKSDSAPAGRVPPGATRPGAAKGSGAAKMPPRRSWLWFVVALVVNFFLVRLLMPGAEGPVTVPYTLFKEEVAKGNVQAIYSRGDTITGRFKAPVPYPAAGEPSAPPKDKPPTTSKGGATPPGPPKAVSSFTTILPAFVDPGLEGFLIDHGVEISAKPIEEGGSPWATLLFGFGPALLIIGFYVWMFRRAGQGGGMGAGLMGIGKSKARRYDQEQDTKVTFDDVAGIDEAENELVEIVDFLKDPPKYTRLGGTAPKGVLLVGPPGTGKTLLARAVAGEAGVPFFSMAGSEFVEMIVGVGAARVRDLFKQAREHAPAIIFIDELDAIGRAQGTDRHRGIERAGADPEPDPDRDGRLLEPGGHHRVGGDQPAGRARQGAPAARALRPARRGEPPGQDRARGDPQGPHPPGAARERRQLGRSGRHNIRPLGGGSQKSGQ